MTFPSIEAYSFIFKNYILDMKVQKRLTSLKQCAISVFLSSVGRGQSDFKDQLKQAL